MWKSCWSVFYLPGLYEKADATSSWELRAGEFTWHSKKELISVCYMLYCLIRETMHIQLSEKRPIPSKHLKHYKWSWEVPFKCFETCFLGFFCPINWTCLSFSTQKHHQALKLSPADNECPASQLYPKTSQVKGVFSARCHLHCLISFLFFFMK